MRGIDTLKVTWNRSFTLRLGVVRDDRGPIRLTPIRACAGGSLRTGTGGNRGGRHGRDPERGLTLAALERALVVAVPRMHHSDQGVQYAATAYVDRLRQLGVTLSMAAVGEPRENGFAERLMRT